MAHVLILLAAVVVVWTALALPLGILIGRRLRRIADAAGRAGPGTAAALRARDADRSNAAPAVPVTGPGSAAAPGPGASPPGGPGAPPVGRRPVRRRAAGRSRGV